MDTITCAACEDEDGPFAECDGTYLCEPCINITEDDQQ